MPCSHQEKPAMHQRALTYSDSALSIQIAFEYTQGTPANGPVRYLQPNLDKIERMAHQNRADSSRGASRE